MLKEINESVLGSDDAMDALDELEETEESSDEDCSSHEDAEDKKLLEKNIFSVEDFFSITTAGTSNGEKEINDVSLKNGEVIVNSLLEVSMCHHKRNQMVTQSSNIEEGEWGKLPRTETKKIFSSS